MEGKPRLSAVSFEIELGRIAMRPGTFIEIKVPLQSGDYGTVQIEVYEDGKTLILVSDDLPSPERMKIYHLKSAEEEGNQ